MADPTPASRVTPVGIPLWDGGPGVHVTITADTDVSFWEIELTPMGFEGGDPVDQTTQFNSTYLTKRPPGLIDTTASSGTAAYDPAVLSQIEALINVESTITLAFIDGSTWASFGWLRSFIPQANVRGTMPIANWTCEHGNWDKTNSVEAGPAVASVAGT